MRIALVAAGGFDRSGREKVIPALLWLVERLSRRHAVHVFTLRHYDEPCSYTLAGATVHDLGRTEAPAGVGAAIRLRRLVRAMRRVGPFDVVHAYWAVPAGVAAGAAGRWLDIPVVVTFDSGEFVALPECEYGLQRRLRSRLAVRLASGLATRVHVCSRHMQRLAAAAGIGVDRAPLGVHTGLFRRPARPPAGPPWRLVHIASLNRIKDQATLLDAMARVVGRIPDVTLDVVGEDRLGGALQERSAALGLDRHVTFHGFQPSECVAAFCQAAHLHVLSSRHEAAGVAVLEAAACGVPTVGTDTGYVSDWSPEAAWSVPPGDADSLADAIGLLLLDRERREAMGRHAERRARTYDADWSAGALEQLYYTVSRRGGR